MMNILHITASVGSDNVEDRPIYLTLVLVLGQLACVVKPETLCTHNAAGLSSKKKGPWNDPVVHHSDEEQHS